MAPAPDDGADPRRTVSMIQLVAVTFLGVCGGAYGLEPAVQAAGPFYAILAVALLPLVWSLGMALMVAELATAMPHNMGYILWVKRAFGEFPGWLNGFASMFCNIIENSLYPTLFVDYLAYFYGDIPRLARVLLQLMVTGLVMYVNILGLDLVGLVSVVFTIIVISPFVMLVFVGLPQLDIAAMRVTVEDPDWTAFLSVVLWNTSGWDSMGCLAGEVENPERTYPMAMFITLIMVILNYLMPLLVTVSVDQDYAEWDDGYFSEIAGDAFGDWLGVWMTISAIFSALGMFNVILATSARAMHGMAELGMLPSILAHTNKTYGTPDMAVVANCALVVVVTFFLDFGAIVELDVFLYAGSIILEFAAFLYLRYSEPDMVRPYKVPFGKAGAWLLTVPSVLLCFFTMYVASTTTWVISLGGLLFGGVMYVLFGLRGNSTAVELSALAKPDTGPDPEDIARQRLLDQVDMGDHVDDLMTEDEF